MVESNVTGSVASEFRKASHGLFAKLDHPILGPFITAWIVCNWEVFYILVGGFKEPSTTVELIKEEYFNWANWEHLFAAPALFTAAYVYLGPIVANWYYLFLHRLDVKRKYKEAVASGLEPITKNKQYEVQQRSNEVSRQNEVLRTQLEIVTSMVPELNRKQLDVIRVPRINSTNFEGDKFNLETLVKLYLGTRDEVEQLKKRIQEAGLKDIRRKDKQLDISGDVATKP